MGIIETIKAKLSGTRKGQLGVGSIAQFAFGLGVGVVLLAVMAAVVAGVQDGFTADTHEYNVTTNGLTGMLNFSSEFDLLGTIMGLALVVGVVIAGFYGIQSMRGGR